MVKTYIHRITHFADGDDQIHFASPENLDIFVREATFFVEQCGKIIRSETSSGYSVMDDFRDINYCSHYYRRIVMGKGAAMIPRYTYMDNKTLRAFLTSHSRYGTYQLW